jgi:deazaflavin-dependent oxidoreductase (nitroreductase family)
MGNVIGSWNLKEKPQGLWRTVLHSPTYLFKWNLGFVMGDRFMLIDHFGRRSGTRYQTPVEVVEHDHDGGEYIVCSGTGAGADWYRNLEAAPAPQIQVGNRRWQPSQRFLDAEEAAARFKRYETAHPKVAQRLLRAMGHSYDGSHEGRISMMADMPMVAFTDELA